MKNVCTNKNQHNDEKNHWRPDDINLTTDTDWSDYKRKSQTNTTFYELKDLKWAGGASACREITKSKRGGLMEHSGTALPTCYWIFYYNGDFSVATSFAQTVKKRDRAEGEKVEWAIGTEMLIWEMLQTVRKEVFPLQKNTVRLLYILIKPEKQNLSNEMRGNPSMIFISLPFLSFWLTPVSESERVCPRAPRPGPLCPSEKEERLSWGGSRDPLCWDWSRVSPCSLLGVEHRESRRLRCPKLPMARYSGPSSYSPSHESTASDSSEVDEGGSVREMQGTEGPEGVFTPRSLSSSPDTHTQGAPRLLAGGEVVSATEKVHNMRFNGIEF